MTVVALIAEEKSLCDLRQAPAITQNHLAHVFGVGQESAHGKAQRLVAFDVAGLLCGR